MTNQQVLLAVVGPTASGKTALSVALAKELGGEVISCDSMQIYRGMNIGTAKPSEEETLGVPHHLIDVADPEIAFSCADYVPLAQRAVEDIAARGKLPIVCGGTGLYLDSLLRGGLPEESASDPALREELLTFAATHGNPALHQRLEAVDPESAAKTHPNNVKRVARALEIYYTTGVTKTEYDRRSQEIKSPYAPRVIGLRYPEREILYRRIDARVEQMLEQGLLQETEALWKRGVFERNATAAQAIGYKELLGYLQGKESLDAAVERLKLATRHYAKRQMTWFGAKDYVQWLDMTREGVLRPFGEILEETLRLATRRQ
ncbi:MAG: tRNA (adenosine(37)-N6)-dimethylallyltransferase MiaA [Clostridia bacterium]|nr:tRNA (adenosine(37)-N6)-dimethylallyltransferase MiaA [Clostridia bacterium]